MPTIEPDDGGGVESDRRTVADQIHDGPQQLLASVGLRLQLLAEDAPDGLRVELEEVRRQVALAREQLRDVVVTLLHPERGAAQPERRGTSRTNTEPDGSASR